MQCPFDGNELRVVNRSGVDIDWCPSCKGVWLERGELDKLIDLVAAAPRPPAPSSAEPGYGASPGPSHQQRPGPAPDRSYDPRWEEQRYRSRDRDDDWDDDDWKKHRSGHKGKHKRKSMLSEIFDF